MFVVVPALNEEACIVQTVRRLLAVHPPVAQVIVVDGGSTDQTVRLAEREGAIVVSSPPGRAKQMNEGAAVAVGRASAGKSILCFVHADTLVPLDLVTTAPPPRLLLPADMREVLAGGSGAEHPVSASHRLRGVCGTGQSGRPNSLGHELPELPQGRGEGRGAGRRMSFPSSLLLSSLADLVRSHSAATPLLLPRLPGPLWRSGSVPPPSPPLLSLSPAMRGAGHVLPRTGVQRGGGIRRIAAHHGGHCHPWACPPLLQMAVILERACRTLTCATVCT